MANCKEGAAIRSPDKPAPAMDASAAKPALIPTIKGMERRKPNCAPDVVANVVAPPGVMVDVNANRASGKSESVAMLLPVRADGHQLRERIRQSLQIVLIVVDMRRDPSRVATHSHMNLLPRKVLAAGLRVHAIGQLHTEEVCASFGLVSNFEPKRAHALDGPAIDKRHQNQGIGRALLRDAMIRAINVARDAGVFTILVHAISDPSRQFYLSRGLSQSPLQPMTLLMTIETMRSVLSEPLAATGGI